MSLIIWRRDRVGPIVAIGIVTWLGALAAQTQPPQFNAGVERLPVDVTVVDANGRPVTDLLPSDFQVAVDGTPRRVVTAEWVDLRSVDPAEAEPSQLPAGFTSNQGAVIGRLIVIVVDQPSIAFGATMGLRATLDRFVDNLAPGDMVAAIGLGSGAPSTGFTADRALIKGALARMNGQRQPPRMSSRRGVDLSTALAVQQGDMIRRDALIARECAQELTQARREACAGEVNAEIQAVAVPAAHEGDVTLRGLETVLLKLAPIDTPKSMVLVSEGFVLEGNQSAAAGRVTDLGSLATAAQASLYVLHVDDQALDLDRGRAASLQSLPNDDRRLRRRALEILATTARGALFSISGSGEGVFERLTNEMSGYYLLGVESAEGDLTTARPLRVTTSRANVIVRARRLFGRGPDAARVRRSPREDVASALSVPLVLSALPLQLATFSMQGSERDRIQLLIRAEVGQRFTAAQSVATAYFIADSQGQIVASQSFSGRLNPVTDGLPSPLAYVAGASLAPGDYTLKLAAAVGDVVGSITHPVRAALTPAGTLTLSDLTVGGPVPTDPPQSPTVDAVVRFGAAHAYVEAYGAAAAAAKVQFEIAADDQSPALVASTVAARPVGTGRAIFSAFVPVNQLPPGRYRLRAAISAGTDRTMLSREFDVSGSVRSTAATESGGNSNVPAATAVFLPVNPADLKPVFDLEEALEPEVVASFTRNLPFETFTFFEDGMAALRRRDLPAAENNLKEAVQPDVDTTAALAYLGAVFAAAGHDAEAAGIWQTALVDSPAHALLYVWIGEALLRTRDLPGALAMLEDGQRRWPDAARFAKPLAMVYASMGRGRDALPLLERHLASGTPSPASLAQGVEWIYRARMEGVVLRSREEDLALAQRYADLYARANGPRQPLIKQWLDYLSRP